MKPVALALAALLAVCSGPVRAGVDGLPTDLVPRGDVVYDLLSILAAEQALPPGAPGGFPGDRVYTREEVGGWLTGAVGTSPRALAAIRLLARRLGQSVDLPPLEAEPLYTGTVRFGLRDDGSDLWGRAAAATPLPGEAWAAAVASNLRRATDRPEEAFAGVETAVAADLPFLGFDWTLGWQQFRWGPGRSGATLLSDSSPALPALTLSREFSLGRLGQWQFTQFSGAFREEGAERYLIGRRLTTRSGRLGFSAAEAIKTTALPAAWQAQVLPLYLYQHLQSEGVRETAWNNYLFQLQATYRAGRGVTFYHDLTVDDLATPRFLRRRESDTPQKIAYLVGISYSDLPGGGRTRGWLEWVWTDGDPHGGTYLSAYPGVEWFQRGRPLGHPAGPNSRFYYARVEHDLTPRLLLSVEAARRRQADPHPTISVGDSDVLAGSVTYVLGRHGLVGAHVRDERRRRGAPGPPFRYAEISAAYRF